MYVCMFHVCASACALKCMFVAIVCEYMLLCLSVHVWHLYVSSVLCYCSFLLKCNVMPLFSRLTVSTTR